MLSGIAREGAEDVLARLQTGSSSTERDRLMRLNRLDLTRYGKFTDHVVDFGARAEGGCDLHIVYGPNEAGKSTLFNGWLDLLYGIGAQSSYNFLHPYPTMQIGAAISVEGKSFEVIRRKRSQKQSV